MHRPIAAALVAALACAFAPVPRTEAVPSPLTQVAVSHTASTASSAAAIPASPNLLGLPRLAWEGGSKYWDQFDRAREAGWSDPHFFPVVAWFDSISTNAEARYDKSLGINTYIGMYEGTPFRLFTKNDLYWIGDKRNETFKESSPNWVGDFFDDEVDGRYPLHEGLDYLQSLEDELGDNERFDYANYTQIVMSHDLPAYYASQYVNDFTDAVSLDMYYYTIPFCDWDPYYMPYLTPVKRSNCRTASSYGKTMNSLRKRDALDGKRQPLWQFVENLNGGPGEGPWLHYIQPDELRGAVMSSIINEARGILYFNQSFTGTCTTNNVFRASMDPDFCGRPQVLAVKEVNAQIRRIAPVINTQTYRWRFGAGLDTMLKARGRYAYVFAMVDGSSQPGQRSIQLPSSVTGREAKVLFENRTLTISPGGAFTDNFAEESTYHIYRMRL